MTYQRSYFLAAMLSQCSLGHLVPVMSSAISSQALTPKRVFACPPPPNTMGPRSSISGELPIESYFSSGGRTAGPSVSKENRSLKRKNARDASDSDSSWALTKKPRTNAPESSEICAQNRSLNILNRLFSETGRSRSKELRVPSASRTTSMPTPNSIMKPPLRPQVQIPDDVVR